MEKETAAELFTQIEAGLMAIVPTQAGSLAGKQRALDRLEVLRQTIEKRAAAWPVYVIVHSHRHGHDTFVVLSDHEPSEEEVVKACDIDFEPDEDEYIDIYLKGSVDQFTTLEPTTPAPGEAENEIQS
jgi:hypothetical protein